MTKVITNTGWVYVVIVLDWYTKKIVGHYSGVRATSREWLEALNKALNRKFPEGVRGHGLKLMSDNGSQPTSLSFMKACSNLEVEQVFTSYNNPKGNADTERMIRTMKEELFWLREWENERELSLELNKWVEYYNRSYLHSAHGYRTPFQAEEEYYRNHNQHLNAVDKMGAVYCNCHPINAIFSNLVLLTRFSWPRVLCVPCQIQSIIHENFNINYKYKKQQCKYYNSYIINTSRK